MPMIPPPEHDQRNKISMNKKFGGVKSKKKIKGFPKLTSASSENKQGKQVFKNSYNRELSKKAMISIFRILIFHRKNKSIPYQQL